MNSRKFFKIGLVMIVILVIVNAILGRLQTKTTPENGSDQAPVYPPNQYQTINPGETNQDKLQTANQFTNKTQRNNFELFEYRSNDTNINDEILVKDGAVKMKKVLSKDAAGNLSPIEAYFKNYGEPEKTGFDAYFGTAVFAWPSKGFAVAGRREINETFRTYSFKPMSVSEFEKEFASEFNFNLTDNDHSLGYP